MAVNDSLVHWSGSVGPLIGYTVRGVRYFRSKPAKVRNPRTEAQTAHRERFGVASSFVRSLGGVYKIGYEWYREEKCPRARMMEQVYWEAMDEEGRVDWRKVKVARGSLRVYEGSGARVEDGWVKLRWSRSGGDMADELTVTVYNWSRGVAMSKKGCAKRGDGRVSVALPEGWEEERVVVWVFWRNEGRRAVSDSAVALTIGMEECENEDIEGWEELRREITRGWKMKASWRGRGKKAEKSGGGGRNKDENVKS